jgi:hypothetical protein
MFSTTLKRSVATLGVMAGLLAAAGPASAQGGGADFTRFVVDGPLTAKAGPQPEVNGYTATDPSSEVDNQIGGEAQDTQTSRASSIKDTLVSGYNVKATAPGTQVGSEGVKVSAVIDDEGTTFDVKARGLMLGPGLVDQVELRATRMARADYCAASEEHVTTGTCGLTDVTDGTSNTLGAAGQARGFSPVDGLKFDTDIVDY